MVFHQKNTIKNQTLKLLKYLVWLPLIVLLIWSGSYLYLRWRTETVLQTRHRTGWLLEIVHGVGLSNGEEPPAGACYSAFIVRNGKPEASKQLLFCYLGMLELEHRIHLLRHHSWQKALCFPYSWQLLLTFGWSLAALSLPIFFLVRRMRKPKRAIPAD